MLAECLLSRVISELKCKYSYHLKGDQKLAHNLECHFDGIMVLRWMCKWLLLHLWEGTVAMCIWDHLMAFCVFVVTGAIGQ